MRWLACLAMCLMVFAGGAARGADIVAGPMLGHVTSNSARVWIQFSEAGQLTLTAFDVEARQAVSAVRVDIEGPSPFVCDIPLQGLRPDHSYRLEFKYDGQQLKIPDFFLRTGPIPGDEAAFSIAFGSDITMTPPTTAPAARPVPADIRASPIFTAIAGSKPRAFFFLGNVGRLPATLEAFPTTHREAYRYITEFHSAVRRASALQQIFSAMPVYGIFSDRDFGPAGATGSYVFANESLVAFQKFWPNPDWGTPQNPGCFTTLSMGDVDFFLLDARTFRSGPPIAGAPAATQPKEPAMFGTAQLDWLKKSLKDSRAQFKILAAPCTLWGDAPNRPDADSWSNFPTEQKSFVDWLGAQRINGLVAISGNHLAGEITEFKTPALAYPLYTLASSSLVLPPGARLAAAGENPRRIGSAVSESTFGTLDFAGEHDHRFVTLRLRDELGKVRAEQRLVAVQLKN